jgi:Flp pilus assembly protein CpaB
MQRNRLLFLGITAAIATWILVDGIQNYLNDGSDRRKVGQPIGIAAKDMSAGHRLVATDFDTEAAGTKGDPSRPQRGLGRILAVSPRKGQVIRDTDLAPQTSGEAIANLLPPGYRAITVTLRDNGPAVSLFPGAIVDVLATIEVQGPGNSQREMVTRTVLERGRVLAVNDDALGMKAPANTAANAIDRRTSNRKMTVTLAATPEQASAVEFASARGTIGIAVRAEDDGTTAAAAAPAPAPTLAPAPAPAPATPAAGAQPAAPAAAASSGSQTWDVLVIRGKDTERHSFSNSKTPKTP